MSTTVKIPSILSLLVQSSLLFKPETIAFVFNLLVVCTLFSPFTILFSPILFFAGNLLLFAFSLYASIIQVFLEQCQPQNIPRGEFSSRLESIQKSRNKLYKLDFQELDHFLLKRNYKTIIIYLKHQEEAIYCTLSNLAEQITFSELMTEFDNGLSLFTTSVKTADVPRPPQHYVQYFEQAEEATLLENHLDAIAVFRDLGHNPVEFSAAGREEFTRLEKITNRYIMSFPGWSWKMLFGVISQAGKRYGKSIKEQLELGTISIPQKN